MSILEINVHGHEVWGAIDEVLSSLEECKLNGDGEINIIHGYKHGQVLKNYFRSNKFLTEMAREGFRLKMKDISNQAISSFMLI
ncbi:MAG: Smr/MutS family protein [Promethearchaeota archaeon]